MARWISIHPCEGGFRISNKGRFSSLGILMALGLGLLLGFISLFREGIHPIQSLIISLVFGLLFTAIELIAVLVKKANFTEIYINQNESKLRVINHYLLSPKKIINIENFNRHKLVFRKFTQKGFKRYSLEYHQNRQLNLMVIPNERDVEQIQQLLKRE